MRVALDVSTVPSPTEALLRKSSGQPKTFHLTNRVAGARIPGVDAVPGTRDPVL
jgi:hypothetical protein